MELVTLFLSSCSLLVLFGLWLIVFNRIAPPPGVPSDPATLAFIVALIFGVLFIIQSWVRGRQSKAINKLAVELKSANIRLTQLDRIKSEFLSFASHQIKAPMSIIKGYATLMIDGTYGIVNPQVKEIGNKIKKSTDRIITFVDTFLDLRRIQEGKVEYQYDTVDLGQLVASIVGELQTLAQAKHITLMLAPMPRAWNVSIDVQRMRQVFQNILENAIKYTDKGSVVVTLSDDIDPHQVEIQVTDTGRGLSADLIPQLFEQFTRDATIAKEIAGTGLGLYIAKQIVTGHKGTIWARSPGLGRGSTFGIILPHL